MAEPWVQRATGVTPRGLDEAEARRALALLADPGAGCELRGVTPGAGASSRTLPGSDLDGLIRAARDLARRPTLYVTLNPVPANLGRDASGKDVLCRRWLLVDVDALRPDTGVMATEDERAAALDTAFAVRDHLTGLGWPRPLLVSSGNGYALPYRVDLPNSDHAWQLCRQALATLHEQFPAVDPSTFKRDQRMRLPGGWCQKGTDTPERPHRQVRLLDYPSELVVVPVEKLMELAGPLLAPRERPRPDPFRQWAHSGRSRAYLEKALRGEMARVAGAPPGTRADTLYKAACQLGELVAGSGLPRGEAEGVLLEGAAAAGLLDDIGEKSVRATVARGLDKGAQQPRGVPERNGRTPGKTPPPPNGNDAPPGPVTVRASTITPRRVEWLWPWRLPLNKLTTFAGPGGLGKTFVLCDITARVTAGLPWPDLGGESPEPGQVLFISGEDDPDDTLVPRLIELGADLGRVSFLSTEVQDTFTLADLKTLDRALGEMGDRVRFVAIDPPSVYLGGVDEHSNAEVRALLSPLKSWAKRYGLSVVFNTHVNKGSGLAKMDAMARVMGSVAWVNAVRAAHMFARDPEDHSRRVFVPMKLNVGKERKGLAYTIRETRDDLARIDWLGEVDTTADQAVGREPGKPRRVVARDWLVERFRERLEWPSDELFRLAREQGVSRDAIFEAKAMLDLPKARQEVLPNGDKRFVWWVSADWPLLKAEGGAQPPSAPSPSDPPPLPDSENPFWEH